MEYLDGEAECSDMGGYETEYSNSMSGFIVDDSLSTIS